MAGAARRGGVAQCRRGQLPAADLSRFSFVRSRTARTRRVRKPTQKPKPLCARNKNFSPTEGLRRGPQRSWRQYKDTQHEKLSDDRVLLCRGIGAHRSQCARADDECSARHTRQSPPEHPGRRGSRRPFGNQYRQACAAKRTKRKRQKLWSDPGANKKRSRWG